MDAAREKCRQNAKKRAACNRHRNGESEYTSVEN